MKRWVWLVVLSLGVVFASRAWADDQAANLVKNGDAETGTLAGWDGFTKVSADNPHAGKYCFIRQGSVIVWSGEFFPVDPAKAYTLSVWMKSLQKAPSTMYAGFAPFDADKNQIVPWSVLVIPGSDTTLFEACKAADKVIKIGNGSKWGAGEWRGIAFKTDDSGKYADLPNHTLSSFNVLKVENKGTHWEVQLKEACGQAFPAGTKVREHNSGGTFMYTAAGCVEVPAEWTQYKGVVTGVADFNARVDQWWPGTKYAKVVLLLNYEQSDKFSMAVDDISMTASAR